MWASAAPVKSWLNTGLGFFYPEICQLCEQERATAKDGFVGPECWRQVRFIRPPFCERCGLPFQGDLTTTFECANCREMELHFTFGALRRRRQNRRAGGDSPVQISARVVVREFSRRPADPRSRAGIARPKVEFHRAGAVAFVEGTRARIQPGRNPGATFERRHENSTEHKIAPAGHTPRGRKPA